VSAGTETIILLVAFKLSVQSRRVADVLRHSLAQKVALRESGAGVVADSIAASEPTPTQP